MRPVRRMPFTDILVRTRKDVIFSYVRRAHLCIAHHFFSFQFLDTWEANGRQMKPDR